MRFLKNMGLYAGFVLDLVKMGRNYYWYRGFPFGTYGRLPFSMGLIYWICAKTGPKMGKMVKTGPKWPKTDDLGPNL
jgi:hypothetical protein